MRFCPSKIPKGHTQKTTQAHEGLDGLCLGAIRQVMRCVRWQKNVVYPAGLSACPKISCTTSANQSPWQIVCRD
jgi:hypothetical protein